jgi:hypothetical protein
MNLAAGGTDRAERRLELVATVLMAVATVLTAWSAFQSTKWGGVQANSYAAAGAARTAASKEATRAGQLSVVDVNTFTSWLAAYAQEQGPNVAAPRADVYTPDPTTLSGFLYTRFRDEFKPAVEAWVASRPLENPNAAPTPFAMPEYVLADQVKSDRLEHRADALSAEARQANQRGDNYVLATVLFASVLFFAGISSKFERIRNRTALLAMGSVILVIGIGILATFPVEV